MQELTSTRLNPLVDPHLHVWHGEVALYLFLGGIVAGMMVVTGLLTLRKKHEEPSRAMAMLPLAAPILLSLGMFFLFLDLEHKLNALRFYLVFKPLSPMSWGSWILLVVYPVVILQAWTTVPGDVRDAVLRRLGRFAFLAKGSDWALANTRRVALVSMIAGASLGIYTGLLLGTMGARPMWNSAILGPLFLTSGLSTAAAFMLLYRLSDRERSLLGKLDMGLISVELILVSLWMIGLSTGSQISQDGLASIIGGPYTTAFWVLVVALGLITPLFAEWLEIKHGTVPGRSAALMVLAGGLALRWILVYGGQYTGWIESIALR